jgi:hypothetical protein
MPSSKTRATLSPAALVQWTARLGAVTAEAVADRYELTAASARARLAAAERDRLLAHRRPLAGEPALYVPTRLGQRAAGAARGAPCRVTPANALHLIACAHAAAALERRYPAHVALGERELLRHRRDGAGDLACARLGHDADGVARTHRPDLVLLPPPGVAEPPVAVEVELTTKSPRRLEAICLAWARCRSVAGVIYLAAPGVERALERAVARADASSKVLVVPFDALVPGATPATGASASRLCARSL